MAVLELVLRGLRGLGFREPEAKQALERVKNESDLEQAPPSDLLRAALRLLTKPAAMTNHGRPLGN